MMDGEAQVITSEPANAPAAIVNGAAETQTEVSRESTQQEQQQEHTSFRQKPPGFDPIDFKTATPEEIEARIGRVYKVAKTNEKENRQLREDNQRLMAAFAEMQNDQKQIINKFHENDYRDSETRLMSDRQAAWDKGDIKAYTTADDGLKQIFAKKVAVENQPKPSPVEQPKPNGYMNGQRMPVQDAVQIALENGEIDPQDANIFKSWESQSDDVGMKLRPWTEPTHPMNAAAAIEGRAVFENPAFKNKTFAQKLQEIDRRMGTQTQGSQNNAVLGSGNLTRGERKQIIALSPQIERMAIRTKFAANNPKLTPQQKASLKDSDHIEAYRQVMIRNQQKGGR